MIFSEVPTDQARGLILAHTLKLPGVTFKKGRRLSAQDVQDLRAAGIAKVMGARLEPWDLDEDTAAAMLGRALAGDGVLAGEAATGRCNLHAARGGLFIADRGRLDALNRVHEGITLATLPPFEPVHAKRMVATVKIIPFAVPRTAVEQCLALVAGNAGGNGPDLRIAPWEGRRTALILTRTPGFKESVLDSTAAITRARIEAMGGELAHEDRCAHTTTAVEAAIARAATGGVSLILVSGASATVDRNDVTPTAIRRLDGEILHHGMPVDPGNLLLLARIGDIDVVDMPGCGRSPKLNGLDWVLRRLMAGLTVQADDIMGMGVGGLLLDVLERPLPRAEAARKPAKTGGRRPRIGAVLLAAGRSSRMGGTNKLLIEVDGLPLVARVADAVLASGVAPVTVVTGHEADAVERILGDRPLHPVRNPRFTAGLSSSLHIGLEALEALDADLDGALIVLADMPGLRAAHMKRLIAAFDPGENRSVCVPTRRGKRGNPVLWDRRFFDEMKTLTGDVGARALLVRHGESVCEVEMEDDAVLTDLDTPEALDAFRAALAGPTKDGG